MSMEKYKLFISEYSSVRSNKGHRGHRRTPPPLLQGGEGVKGRDGSFGNSRKGDEGQRKRTYYFGLCSSHCG